MKRIAILKVTSIHSEDCYECGGQRDLELICDFEEVSDEDYNILQAGINRQGYGSVPRYVMIEPKTVEETKEDLKSVLAKLKKEEKEYKEREKKQKEIIDKRQETLRLKREEKERKKFLELKRKFEESNGSKNEG